MRVDPVLFTDAMQRKWTEYGNVSSLALLAVWGEIRQAMNCQLATPSLPRPVIPAELGAGKTTAAKMYCAMLPPEGHPGVLIVVRTIDQAEEYAREINEWSGRDEAFAFHSDLRPKPRPAQLHQAPTLVICHRGYELALDELTVEDTERYDKVMTFRTGRRGLVIVDEALDQVYVARIPRKGLRRILGEIPEKIQRERLTAIKVLTAVNVALLEAPGDVNGVIKAETLLASTGLSVDEADAALVALWADIRGSKMPEESKKFAKDTLSALRRHLALYRWTEGELGQTALIGSHLLLPPDAGQVLLDATGALNNVYLGRPNEYQVRSMAPVRNYRNVTLYAARTRGTGKWAMAQRGAEIAQEALDAVLAHYGPQAVHRRVLVVADLNSEDEVRGIWSKGGFAELDVAHWNKIDGRNEWRDFDTLVTLSLHYGPSSFDLATYTAIKGVELDDTGLNEPPDEVRIMREARIAAALSQAIGRIRLRRMTHEDGTCEPCDIFARFPNFDVRARTDMILDGLRFTLPGLRVVEWTALSTEVSYAGRIPAVRSRLSETVLKIARGLQCGQQVELTRETVGGTNGSFHRMLAEAQKPGSTLYATLEEAGCRVEPGGYRRGVTGRFPATLRRA